MTTRFAAILAAALMLMSAGTLKAQTPQAPVPVDVVSNETLIIDAEKKIVFTGEVDATRGTTTREMPRARATAEA